MLDLNALLVFARVAECQSFTEAARRLGMPVSTTSRRIAELENQLGVRLFERSTRRLKMTDAGSEILAYAQRGVEISEAVGGIASNRQVEVRGLLRLSAPPSISDSLLAPLINAFQLDYPEVDIRVLVTARHVDHIAEGVDLALRLGPLDDSALIAQPMLHYRHRLVANPDYLRRAGSPEHPLDLERHRLLAFSQDGARLSWTFQNGEQRETVRFRPRVTMNDFMGLAAMLAAGGGIGELPPVVAPALFASGRLVEVLPQWRFPTQDLLLVHLGNRHIAQPVRAFKAFALREGPALAGILPR